MKYAVLFALLLLSSCKVGPKYQKPEMALASKFEEGKQEGSDSDLYLWWQQFNDPVLNECISIAVRSNYDLLLALEKIEQARAQYRIEKSHLWPEIDLNATVSRSRISQNFFQPVGKVQKSFLPLFLNVFQVGFDAIWEMDFFGKFRRSKDAAYYQWQATREDAEAVRISMISEVAVNYVTLRALQKKIALIEEKLKLDEEELLLITDLFDIGLKTEIDIAQTISSMEEDRAGLPPLQTAFKQTVYTLAYLLGKQPEGILSLFEEKRPIPSGAYKVPLGLPSDLLRRRPDIRSAERQLAAATEQIGVAIADLFPHISLTGVSLGSGNQGASFTGFESSEIGKLFRGGSYMFSVGPSVRWDLLDFGRVRSNIAVKTSLQKQALLSYEQTVIASLRDVEGALVAYFDEGKRKASLEEKVNADLVSSDITQELYAIGLANEMDVIKAKKALLIAENSLVESERALTSDLVALYKAIGGSWEPPKESGF